MGMVANMMTVIGRSANFETTLMFLTDEEKATARSIIAHLSAEESERAELAENCLVEINTLKLRDPALLPLSAIPK
ncbi:unnamed protein product [Dibothriocephalus latus]|uniref:Uncharacterized protein n=1 Tax=Dibothriocephalus latus TaxID=60516 RepID=A0A3P7LKP3_DIBLA|nr:unnamed protein product [Dibothriocephalus latus]